MLQLQACRRALTTPGGQQVHASEHGQFRQSDACTTQETMLVAVKLICTSADPRMQHCRPVLSKGSNFSQVLGCKGRVSAGPHSM